MTTQDDLLLKARAIELIRSESDKSQKRRKTMIFLAGMAAGIIVAAEIAIHWHAIAKLLHLT